MENLSQNLILKSRSKRREEEGSLPVLFGKVLKRDGPCFARSNWNKYLPGPQRQTAPHPAVTSPVCSWLPPLSWLPFLSHPELRKQIKGSDGSCGTACCPSQSVMQRSRDTSSRVTRPTQVSNPTDLLQSQEQVLPILKQESHLVGIPIYS